MDAYRWFLFLHIGAGTLALTTFWINAVMRKGSALHRRVGQAYLFAMIAVLLSGVPLCLALLERGRTLFAVFLAYLLLLTGSACWGAWRAVRDRRDRARYYGAMYWIISALVGACGGAIVWLGTHFAIPLFQIFGAVGVLAAADAVRSWHRAPRDPKWWLKEHYAGIIGCGVATHIAFIGIGLRNAWPTVDPQLLQTIGWFGPLLGAIVATIWLGRKYGAPETRPGPMTTRPAPSET